MDTYCLTCGQRYRLGTDHACPKKSTAARKDVPRYQDVNRGQATGMHPEAMVEASTQASPVDIMGDLTGGSGLNAGSKAHAPAKFDKVAYQRDYMRQRRARLKETK